MGKPATLKDVYLSAALLSIANMGDAFLYAYLPANYSDLGISTFWVGVILSVNRLTRLFLNGRVAWFMGSRGVKSAIIVAMALSAIATASYGWLTLLPLWILARVLWGVSFSALRLGNILYSLEYHRKGIALGLSRAVNEVGPVIALLACPVLLSYMGSGTTFLLLGLITLLAALLVLPLTELPKYEATGKDLALSPPSAFSQLVFINAFISEGVLVVLLCKFIQQGPPLTMYSGLAVISLLLGYRRLAYLLFSAASGWLADRYGFRKVFIYTTFLSILGLLLLLIAPIAGIMVVFTFSAMNASVAIGGAIGSGGSMIKEVSDTTTWRDIGTAIGAFVGALLLPVDDTEVVIASLLMIYAVGLLRYGIKDYGNSTWHKLRLLRKVAVLLVNIKTKKMETGTLEVLRKTIFGRATTNESSGSCCGGAPKSNEDACCKLDEDKKAEGESGCGCQAPASESKATSVCCA